ncbi:hypothetical protein XENTR_v10009997 [Xenopus tropicalis]|nr:hypothetical protein XENTR_v10009997 [Xenopus tropicalis]
MISAKYLRSESCCKTAHGAKYLTDLANEHSVVHRECDPEIQVQPAGDAGSTLAHGHGTPAHKLYKMS